MNISSAYSHINKTFGTAFLRFPVLLFYAFIFCCFYSYCMVSQFDVSKPLFFSSILTFHYLFIAYLISEQAQLPKFISNLMSLMVLVFGILCYIFFRYSGLDLNPLVIVFTVLMVVGVLITGIIPFIKSSDEEEYLRYNLNKWENVLEASILSLILFLLLLLAIGSVEKLFDVELGKIEEHLGLWIGGFYTVINFVSHYPKLPMKLEFLNHYNRSRFFSILVAYIGIPVSIIYALILYAYIVRYFSQDFEIKDWAMSLSGWFMVISMIVFLINKVYIKDNDSKIGVMYNKYYPIACIPLALFFNYVCFQHIDVYGLESWSYYLIILSIVLTTICALALTNKSVPWRWIELGIIIILLMTLVVGPFNSWNMPMKSYKTKVIGLLKKHDIIKNDAFNINHAPMEKEDLATLNKLFLREDQKKLYEILKPYDKKQVLNDKMYQSEIMNVLKIESYLSESTQNSEWVEISEYIEPINFSSKDQYLHILKYGQAPINYSGLKLTETGQIEFYEKGKLIDEIILKHNQLRQKQITAYTVKDSIEVTFHLTNMNYSSQSGAIKVIDMNGIALRHYK